jgi:hypothetical protein
MRNAGDELRKGLLHRIGYKEEFTALWLEHAFGNAVIEEDQEFVVEAVDVEQKDGFGVDLEGVPGEDFEEFFKSTEAAG